MKFYYKVTCQDIVFLTTHLLTFLACSVLVIKTWILLGIMNLSHRHQRVQNMLIWTIRDKIDVPSVRKLYLIIYSQADVGRFPPRQSFVEAVLYSFYDTPDKIMHRNKRWLSSKRFLLERCGISAVHFSGLHRFYFSAWKYLNKQDKEFVESPGHPDLSDGLPKTTKASFANKPHSTEVRARNRFVMTLQIAIKKAAKVAVRKIT